ncbi:MAG: bifunctional UDP-3-O-[3-hydroxymyristoyl] N-acetylglucosamine deacetylase/3-hydroxyacyl-ACP dehydratase [Candidatus Xiphinematobacter sp.]|nr:MAG: bifunctional UDP-3-O-[3-hydroxymyristoyl] N-acetylglucosamine deacetylase/3-hydroxyacyl-ACP dehydratase [Candidatus Xiphinematobacter sp.]QQY09055.1 MAG: bifunctional UDP-3-O-[3-hydroxymyristoyl] N-acetylglucosamine deacetylase/3-hydroxyacyl-ACP dehydratase [Candidatus Xiphinematobacter sp.]QQY10540.1 MAG: bifunctional UDP-3-O-[3-hydroxymyristoyl] N-acetylglucosamine deacetylase/3-hydroxyacyl-ACP dehydratase [Candidatus Xiphinematobacter sp.]QQY11277.1 MAG: bifunctional UDP-3-O-[3-hydrox
MSVEKQRTFAQSATLTGISLHTGENVHLTIHPANPGYGVKFQRKDLPNQPIVEAKAENVKTVERATTIVNGNVQVHTVEHILSALSGMGVDNALVEMDANEPPIGDGSAQPFVRLIRAAGIIEQEAALSQFEVLEPIHLESREGSLLTVVPDNKFRISCTQVGPKGQFTQFLSSIITPEIYEKEIAPARTFVFYEDVRMLMQDGLIKGGSLENAIVARGDSVLSREPLRFPDEFVRHKILDIVGDLALMGRRLCAHVIAVRPGHGPNTELAKLLAKRYTQLLATTPVPTISRSPVLDVHEVMRTLPHRYPFLMVDRVIELRDDMTAVGVKSVTINEPYFQGHFPGHPVMPGVLQLEAMAQVASILMMRKTENSGKIGYFMSADDVKFRRPVVPGDTLFIHAKMVHATKRLGRACCKCLVNNTVVSEASLLFGLVSS